MPTLTCTNGHKWPAMPGAAAEAAPCPVCGANAGPLTPGPGAPPTPSQAEPPTNIVPPVPSLSFIELTPGSSVAGYEILEVLGRGGMGIVYKARQMSLKRTVALKMIHADKGLDPTSFARFRREAEAIARLQHPNIVQIYEIGEHEGVPFFSLEYVAGGNLAAQLRSGLPSVRQAAALVEGLARGVQHAHDCGILHRDLKPGNVLLAAPNEPVSGVRGEALGVRGQETGVGVLTPFPKIADFGLAKHFLQQGEEPLTQSGIVVGTPNYMAPEQARGAGEAIGPATDIYALGAILYHTLTGRPPFQRPTPTETMYDVVHENAVPPSLLRDNLPRDLETICLTCLRKEPAGRYPSAAALAEDLAHFLAGTSIAARPDSARERITSWVRRRPLLASLVLLAVVTGLGLVLGAFWINALVVGALLLALLLVAATWHSAGLRAALHEARRHHGRAERNAQRLAFLLDATQKLMTTTNAEDLLRLLSETSTRLLDAERATIFLLDEKRRELWSKVALGDGVGEIRVPLGEGIAGTVAVSGETIVLADPYSDPRFNAEVDRRTGYTTRNLLTLPMTAAGGRILGVFQVLNKRGGRFAPEDAEILAALASSAANAVEARLQS